MVLMGPVGRTVGWEVMGLAGSVGRLEGTYTGLSKKLKKYTVWVRFPQRFLRGNQNPKKRILLATGREGTGRRGTGNGSAEESLSKIRRVGGGRRIGTQVWSGLP